jgi:hypothetical protein
MKLKREDKIIFGKYTIFCKINLFYFIDNYYFALPFNLLKNFYNLRNLRCKKGVILKLKSLTEPFPPPGYL